MGNTQKDWLDELADDAGTVEIRTPQGKKSISFKYPETKDLVAINAFLQTPQDKQGDHDGGVVGFMSDVIGMCCNATVKDLRKREPSEWARVLNATSPKDVKISPIAAKALELCGLDTITEGIEGLTVEDRDKDGKVEKTKKAITPVPS